MNTPFSHIGLYAIVDTKVHQAYGVERLLQQIVKESTIPVIQLRMNYLDEQEKNKWISKTVNLKKTRNFCLIVNNDLTALERDGVDGVHLGQHDGYTPAVQTQYPHRIIGISTHNVSEATQAQEWQATYIGCGAVFSTKTKQDTSPLGIEGLKKIVSAVSLPQVAISGIRLDNIAQVAQTGCSMAAVISGLVENRVFMGQKLHKEFVKHTL